MQVIIWCSKPQTFHALDYLMVKGREKQDKCDKLGGRKRKNEGARVLHYQKIDSAVCRHVINLYVRFGVVNFYIMIK